MRTALRNRIGLVALLGALLSLSSAAAQDKKPKKNTNTFTDPAEAGPDYLIQGEYAGKIGTEKAGAQVVARGDGKFDIYFLTGGLPGAGWDKKGRTKVEARTVDGKTTFASKDKEWMGAIADGKLTGKGKDGDIALSHVVRKSPTEGAKAPPGALILFDGTSAAEWGGGKIVERDLLFCGTNSKKKIGAGLLHIEFRTPFQPKAGGQGRGNSGVYIQQNHEVQVLDSFGLTGANNECGAFYGRAKPAVNMCFPPLTWQTYDIDVKADADGNTVATVLHNGVKVHDNIVLRKGAPLAASINLQNHGNPVVYRNIWFVPAK